MVNIPVHSLHTSELYWGDNCTEFFPFRFVENPDLVKEWFYLPFGGGPRNCMGKRLGLMQGRACIAYIVKHFNIRFADNFVDDVCVVQKILFAHASKPIDIHFDKIELQK